MTTKTKPAKSRKTAKSDPLVDVNDLPCKYAHFGPDQPLNLDSGGQLSPLTIAYETYGELNAEKSNAISLPCPDRRSVLRG